MLGLQSYKLNQGAHYVAHLKISENDKLALKEFDRRLPFENEDLAIAAGIESTIPSRQALMTCVFTAAAMC